MKAEVKNLYGVPTIVLDGKPVSGLMHWTKTPTEEDTAFFRDANIHFYSFMGNLNVPAPAGVPREELDIYDGGMPRMLMTRENIDRVMSMLVRVDPQICILPRIIMNPPLWWEKRHPEELMCYYRFATGDYHHGPRASLASDRWNTLWQAELRRTITYFEERWGQYIFGYHTGLGHCGEHAYQWWDNAADFSEVNRGAFRKWLKQEYRSINGLNQAWRTEFVSFEDILLPNGMDFADFGPRAKAVFLPEQEQSLIDFQRFSSDAMADMLLEEARVVKSELARLGSHKLYGAFYGYVNLVANSTQCTVGHSALTRVLESEDVDFLCGPLSYGARQNGGVALPQMILNSITLHGKAFYNEDDTGTHTFHGDHHGYVPATATDSVAAERRNFLATWSSGGSLWWMDLYGSKWFLAPELQTEFARLNSFAEARLDDRVSRSEIAVFVSLKSLLCMRDTPVPLSGNLIEQQLFEIASCGAPFDLYQDEDLPLLEKSGKLTQYKLCIFPNLLAPTPKVCEIIDRVLKQAGRTLLWFYMPGYYDGTELNRTKAEALTGIRFSVVNDGIMPMLTEFWHGEERFIYGLSRAVYPRFSANDPEAEELGFYVNGTTIAGQPCGSGAAMVAKTFPEWRSVWSSSPGMPASELRNIAKTAGVHIYTNDGSQVFRCTDWLGVHAKRSGTLTIALPESGLWRDGITDQSCPVGDHLTVELRRGETAYWVTDNDVKSDIQQCGGYRNEDKNND